MSLGLIRDPGQCRGSREEHRTIGWCHGSAMSWPIVKVLFSAAGALSRMILRCLSVTQNIASADLIPSLPFQGTNPVQLGSVANTKSRHQENCDSFQQMVDPATFGSLLQGPAMPWVAGERSL